MAYAEPFSKTGDRFFFVPSYVDNGLPVITNKSRNEQLCKQYQKGIALEST